MTGDDDDLPAGWLTQFRRGLVSGTAIVLIAVAVCAVPAFLVWFVPGADTSSPVSAIKAAGLVVISASHGGVRLNGVSVSLAPLLVTAFVGWLLVSSARRMDTWSNIVGLSAGFGLASGVLGAWARLGSTFAPFWPSVLAGALVAGALGGGARLIDQQWEQLSDRWQGVLRASGAVTALYLAAGAMLAATAVATHLSDAAALQRQVAPGASGLPIALLGIAATPNGALAGAGYLAGPGFDLGSATSVSALTVQHGQLPVFPMLAGVPSGRPATALGFALIVVVALMAGWLVYRMTAASGSWRARITDCAAIAVLSGGVLALLCGLSGGGIGSGALADIGPVWWSVGGCVIGLVLLGSVFCSALDQLARVWSNRQHSEDIVATGPAMPLRVVETAAPAEDDAAMTDTEGGAVSNDADVDAAASDSDRRSRNVS